MILSKIRVESHPPITDLLIKWGLVELVLPSVAPISGQSQNCWG